MFVFHTYPRKPMLWVLIRSASTTIGFRGEIRKKYLVLSGAVLFCCNTSNTFTQIIANILGSFFNPIHSSHSIFGWWNLSTYSLCKGSCVSSLLCTRRRNLHFLKLSCIRKFGLHQICTINDGFMMSCLCFLSECFLPEAQFELFSDPNQSVHRIYPKYSDTIGPY